MSRKLALLGVMAALAALFALAAPALSSSGAGSSSALESPDIPPGPLVSLHIGSWSCVDWHVFNCGIVDVVPGTDMYYSYYGSVQPPVTCTEVPWGHAPNEHFPYNGQELIWDVQCSDSWEGPWEKMVRVRPPAPPPPPGPPPPPPPPGPPPPPPGSPPPPPPSAPVCYDGDPTCSPGEPECPPSRSKPSSPAPLIEGVLRDEGCNAVPGEVHVFFLPDGSSDSGTEVEVAHATAGDDGEFAVAADGSDSPLKEALAAAAKRGSTHLHFSVVTSGKDGSLGFTAFSRFAEDGQWREGPVTDARPPEPRTIILRWHPGESKAGDGSPDGVGCTFTYTVLGTATRQTKIGELHSAGDVTTARFSYGTHTGSDIGVGVSVDGGVFHVEGEVHIGTTQNYEIGTTAGSEYGRELTTRFVYQKDRFVYRCPGFTWRVDSVYPTGWAGDIQEGVANHNLDHRCNTVFSAHRSVYGRGADVARTSGRYTKWRVAVSLGFWGTGLDLSSESDMSRDTGYEYVFGRGQSTHVLCGVNGFWRNSRRFFAGDRV